MNLYNKERPLRFRDVVGQDKVISQLRGLILGDSRPSAFLLIGPRGTGKTTVARIMARAVNCVDLQGAEPCNVCASCRSILTDASMDVRELDAASNNKVEDIRELVKSTQYASIGKKKVYILDEVHMLSAGAFNALLKTLEEPPGDCIFILCTTEEHKVPVTIQSRCSRFYFEKMDVSIIADYLAALCDKYNVAYEMDGLKLIARAADGCMRDALSILEPGMINESLSTDMIRECLGYMKEDAIFEILRGMIQGNVAEAVTAFHDVVNRGYSVSALLKEMVSACCDIIYVLQSGKTEKIAHTASYIQGIESVAGMASVEGLLRIVDGLSDAFAVSSRHGNIGFLVEMEILKVISNEASLTSLEERITFLEEQLRILQSSGVTEQSCIGAQGDMTAGSVVEADVMPVQQDEECPETEEFGEEEILPGDNSSTAGRDLMVESGENYPLQNGEAILDDGSRVVGSINLFGTAGQSQSDQPAAVSEEDLMGLGMFAGFVRP